MNIKKILNALLFIIFTLFAIIQLNDPDPAVWFTLYMLVSIISLVAIFKPIPRKLTWLLIISFSIYATFHFSSFLDYLKIKDKSEIFGEMVYEKPYLEGTREFLGLLIAVGGLFYQLKKNK